MELGRECLDLWGYKFVQEFLWVKTNQLPRIIRTGRTGPADASTSASRRKHSAVGAIGA